MRELKKAIPPGVHETYVSPERYERHRLLPYPNVKWSDFYQSMSECATQVIRDRNFIWMLKLKRKKAQEKAARRDAVTPSMTEFELNDAGEVLEVERSHD